MLTDAKYMFQSFVVNNDIIWQMENYIFWTVILVTSNQYIYPIKQKSSVPLISGVPKPHRVL